MTAASIGTAKGGGYARYLEGKTVTPERGDYYLMPDGEMTQAPGRWLANDDTLAALGIQPGEPVQGADFIALMEGRHPGTGRWLRPEGGGGGRGGGIDVTFSAPKSVSTVWALGDPWQRKQLEAAHARAVEQTILYLREQVPVVRRRYDGQAVEENAKDVIAAEYRHTTARGVAGGRAPDPQLHSHVVITGAVREDDRVVAISSRPIFRNARELGAFYRSQLAHELANDGYQIKYGTGKDGRYFELAGVPQGLLDDFSGRSREVARAAERFRARYGRAPERGELRGLALENRRAKQPTTRADLQQAWADTGHRHGFGHDQALQLLSGPERTGRSGKVEDRIEAQLTQHRAVFDARELRTVALEQTAGEMLPDTALEIARAMGRDRRILTLQDGRMTTLAIRAQEQAIERRATALAQPAGRDAGDASRQSAVREVAERIAAPLSAEQHAALHAVTGPERLAVLIGPAGTGKGIVIDAAARAEQHAGRTVLGIAVSGSTAERLGAETPSLSGRTLTLDSLVARARTGSIHVDHATTIFLDEAGMADHQRLDALTELVACSGAKLIAIGDGKQLPSIGPGGMFDRLSQHAHTAELADIFRTKDPAEQRAWQALRAGEPERAMAHYVLRNQLHFQDTRDMAGEAAVQRWHELTQQQGTREVALIADASNQEIDRLNARAQHLRGEHGELGHHTLQHPDRHYSLHQGDLIAFTKQHRPPGQPRVENGSRGEIVAITPRGITIALDGSDRHINLHHEHLDAIRLGYAQHVYRQQGATVQRSVVLTGGWQTSKESAYVEATRARHGTDWYLARDQLGDEGQDPDRARRLAEHMRNSRVQTPSLALREHADTGWEPSRNPLRFRSRLSSTRWLTRTPSRDTPDRSAGRRR